jgi:hypothetical protein
MVRIREQVHPDSKRRSVAYSVDRAEHRMIGVSMGNVADRLPRTRGGMEVIALMLWQADGHERQIERPRQLHNASSAKLIIRREQRSKSERTVATRRPWGAELHT